MLCMVVDFIIALCSLMFMMNTMDVQLFDLS